MLAEIKAAKPDLNVEILGVNQIGAEAGNPLIASIQKLPWLQDTSQDAVWKSWGVTYRDVRLVDSQGRLWAIMNLSSNDLGIDANYQSLKQMFLTLAKMADSDHDGIPDDWEKVHFGNLTAGPSEDPDQDGYDNITEFTYGSDPLDPKSTPLLSTTRLSGIDGTRLEVTCRRRAGGWMNYFANESSDLSGWFANANALSGTQTSRNLFDGTGCLELTWSVPATNSQAFFKLRATTAH